MKQTWLLLDVPNLAYRNFYVLGDLSNQGIKIGVIFGILRDIQNLLELFSTDKIVFCFDAGNEKRLTIYPDYKAKRKEKVNGMTKEELEAREQLHKQINKLRDKILPFLGFRNIFWQDGYEADDVIASICSNTLNSDKAVIISTDSDLFQLLSGERIVIWNPRKGKVVTEQSFVKERGISCSQWADVKAIAGCHSDDIPGIRGIGEKTAVRFLQGRIKPDSTAYNKIVLGNEIWRRNIRLTQLPFIGVDSFELVEDRVTKEKWQKAMEKLGIKSLEYRPKGIK